MKTQKQIQFRNELINLIGKYQTLTVQEISEACGGSYANVVRTPLIAGWKRSATVKRNK